VLVEVVVLLEVVVGTGEVVVDVDDEVVVDVLVELDVEVVVDEVVVVGVGLQTVGSAPVSAGMPAASVQSTAWSVTQSMQRVRSPRSVTSSPHDRPSNVCCCGHDDADPMSAIARSSVPLHE